MATARSGAGPAPVLSAYASRYFSRKAGQEGADSQIFRSSSPNSSAHNPFLPSPSETNSHHRLAGSSRSPSPTQTPPYPGPGIDSLPDIDAMGRQSDIGTGLLFGEPGLGASTAASRATPLSARSKEKARSRPTIPNPYAASSSESEDEIEADLDEVATVRRSTARPLAPRQPVSEGPKKGWRAHQSVFPASSSSSSSGETDDKVTEAETETEDDERSTMMGRSRQKSKGRSRSAVDREADEDPEGYMLSPSELYGASSRPPVEAVVDDMEEPLLGPEDIARRGGTVSTPGRLQVYHGRFGHWEREGLRKYKGKSPEDRYPPADSPSHRPAPSIIPLIPLLLVLLIPSIIIPPAFLLLLQKTVRPVLLATAISIPFSLFICGWWCLGASFETGGWDGIDQGERWWGTTGLRLLAGVLWVLAAGFGRMVWVRRKRLERTVAVVELSTHLLLTHAPLLLLTPLLLAVFAIASLPFLTLIVRLGMIGYWRHPRENTYIYHLRPYAGWLIFLVTLIWVWTWGVLRGIGRVAIAGVIGEWYFHRDEPSHPPALEITQAAMHRATGSSLGSICLGAGIVATVRMVGRGAAELKRLTSPRSKVLPASLAFLTRLTPFFAIVASVLDQMNGYALVYVGITGEAFWPSARKAVSLAGRRKGGHLLDYTLIKLLLTLSSTALGLFTGTAGYLYMAHALSNPAYAPVAGMLCGGVPFLAVRAGAAVLGDAADALFICHQIDRDAGGDHCEEAKVAFAGEKPSGPTSV